MMWEASLKDFVISDTVSLFKSYFTSLLWRWCGACRWIQTQGSL